MVGLKVVICALFAVTGAAAAGNIYQKNKNYL